MKGRQEFFVFMFHFLHLLAPRLSFALSEATKLRGKGHSQVQLGNEGKEGCRTATVLDRPGVALLDQAWPHPYSAQQR